MQAIILCGGQATRLGKIAKHTPKILLEVNGQTVLENQIALLKDAGIDEVILATGHLHNEIYEVARGCYNGVKIRYSYESVPLGTGGAVKQAFQFVDEFPVVILDGDNVYEGFTLKKMIEAFKNDTDGLILAQYVSDVRDFGHLRLSVTGEILCFDEKPVIPVPGFVNAGVVILNPVVMPHQQNFSLAKDVFPHLRLRVHLQSGMRWTDIGTIERLFRARGD